MRGARRISVASHYPYRAVSCHRVSHPLNPADGYSSTTPPVLTILRPLLSFQLFQMYCFGMISLMSKFTRRVDPPARLHVVLEPRAGHTLHELVLALEQAGATEIDQIGVTFVSAEIHSSSLSGLESIAFVETKKPHGLA